MRNYLHVYALSTRKNYAKQMLQLGEFALVPNTDVPYQALDMFLENPQVPIPPPIRATTIEVMG